MFIFVGLFFMDSSFSSSIFHPVHYLSYSFRLFAFSYYDNTCNHFLFPLYPLFLILLLRLIVLLLIVLSLPSSFFPSPPPALSLSDISFLFLSCSLSLPLLRSFSLIHRLMPQLLSAYFIHTRCVNLPGIRSNWLPLQKTYPTDRPTLPSVFCPSSVSVYLISCLRISLKLLFPDIYLSFW